MSEVKTKMKRPTTLRSPSDVQEWNEWMAVESAEGRISAVVLNGLNKVIDAAIKINMKIPMEYFKIIARSGKNNLSVSVPWLDQIVRREAPELIQK